MSHFHIIRAMPGYLPDFDESPVRFGSFAEALEALRDEPEALEDCGCVCTTPRRSPESYPITTDGESWAEYDSGNQTVEVVACAEACEADDSGPSPDPTDAADAGIPARSKAGQATPCAACGTPTLEYDDTGGGFVYALCGPACRVAFFGDEEA